eukprot:5103810-Pyramimonas_sp.AAC.1
MHPSTLAPCFLTGKILVFKLGSWPPGVQQQRLPPETSFEFTQDPRSGDFLTIYSGLVLPQVTSSQFSQDPRSHVRLLHNLLRNGAPA